MDYRPQTKLAHLEQELRFARDGRMLWRLFAAAGWFGFALAALYIIYH